MQVCTLQLKSSTFAVTHLPNFSMHIAISMLSLKAPAHSPAALTLRLIDGLSTPFQIVQDQVDYLHPDMSTSVLAELPCTQP